MSTRARRKAKQHRNKERDAMPWLKPESPAEIEALIYASMSLDFEHRGAIPEPKETHRAEHR